MTRNPSDVGRAPVHIVGLILENVSETKVGVDHVASASMHHAFGLTRATGSI